MRVRSKPTAMMFVAATVAALTGFGAPAAQAAGDTIAGGCFADFANNVFTGNMNNGIVGDVSATRDASGPVFATVSCEIHLNGVLVPDTGLSASGTGFQQGTRSAGFVSSPTDDVELCQRVVFADGFDTGQSCEPDVIFVRQDSLSVNRLFPEHIDPVLCPTFAQFTGDNGLVSIAPSGDVSVLGILIYDCPPYGTTP